MIDLAEFTEDYIRMCKDSDNPRWTNREIAEAYAERLDEVPLDEDDYEELLDQIEKDVAYYTGKGV